MRLDLNLATVPPEPRGAFALSVGMLCACTALALVSVASTAHVASELREDRAKLAAIELPAIPQSTPRWEIVPYLHVTSEPRPALTQLLAALERKLPEGTFVRELRWQTGTLEITLGSASAEHLSVAEGICKDLGFSVASHASSDAGFVALLRREGAGR